MKLRRRIFRKRELFFDVDVEAVLRLLEIEYRRKGKELFALCPNPKHEDKNPSWSICAEFGNKTNGLFNCWSCGFRGSIISLVMLIRGIDKNAAIKLVNRARQKSGKIVGDFEERYYPNRISFDQYDIRPIEIKKGSLAWKYLASRGISPIFIDIFNLMDLVDEKRLIIPIVQNGKLISWIGRTYNNDKPKTVAPKGVKKVWELFGYDLLVQDIKTVHLVEGWADLFRLMQAGRNNVVACCGSKMSEQQASLLQWVDCFVVWADGDKAGRLLPVNIHKWFPNAEIFVMQMPEKRDPGDMSVGELNEVKLLTFEDWYYERF